MERSWCDLCAHSEEQKAPCIGGDSEGDLTRVGQCVVY
jgi:hypothetical protein